MRVCPGVCDPVRHPCGGCGARVPRCAPLGVYFRLCDYPRAAPFKFLLERRCNVTIASVIAG